MTAARAEVQRRWTHLLFGLPAFALPDCDWRLALLVAVLALVMNFEFWPRTTLAQPLFRSNEARWGGIVLYPLTVALLILIFRERLDVAAMAWIVLAFGDPAAATFGKSARRRWPFNPEKSPRGSWFFVMAAGVALGAFHSLEGTALGPALAMTILPALFGAAAESLPWPRDDNLVVGLAAALGAIIGAHLA